MNILSIRRLGLLPVLILSLCVGCGAGDDDDSGGSDDNSPLDDSGDDDVDDSADDDSSDDDTTGDDDTAPPTSPGYVYVPSGSFFMGSPESETGHRSNESLHEVTLTRHFEMKTTEVSQGEFKDAMDFNPSYYPWAGRDLTLPVETVSWYDALAYANKISEIAGYAPCYVLTNILGADGNAGNAATWCAEGGGIFQAAVALHAVESVYDCEGFRLPTEAEWEYAARAGTQTATYAGDPEQITCLTTDSVLDGIAWYCNNSRKMTKPVGTKQPNAWDLYDTLGNVSEWTWDWYRNVLTGPAVDPEGADGGHFRSVRGAAFRYDGAARVRAAFRTAYTPDYRTYLVGIRTVRTLPAEAPALRPSPPLPAPPATAPRLPTRERDWPDELPFSFTRPQVGTPLTPEEITEFTETLTGFYADSLFIRRLLWVGHGMAEGNDEDWPDYKLQLQDFSASKSGNVVTFTHTGNSDNLMITTGKLFTNIAAGYLASGDADMRRFLVTHAKGIKALIMGMIFTDDDPEPVLMPRTPFPGNHSYTEEGGRQTVVDYDPAKNYRFDWNGWTIPNAYNPYWGPTMWIRNMRSKDDVPHIYRTIPWLMRLTADAPDEDVRETAGEALEALTAFTRDIVEMGYTIRTKDESGNAFIPWNKDYPKMINDLASFEAYTDILPSAECAPRLASALIAYEDPLGVDCGNGIGWAYELVASYQHYFNWAIIRYFHVASAHMALMTGHDAIAKDLVEGLAIRADDMMAGVGDWDDSPEWLPDQAGFLLAAATVGLPLTDEEAQLVRSQYTQAVDWYEDWPYWDPWDVSVPDGAVPTRPGRNPTPSTRTVRWEEMIYLLEYCQSPFRNPAGAELVDCSVILDPTQW